MKRGPSMLLRDDLREIVVRAQALLRTELLRAEQEELLDAMAELVRQDARPHEGQPTSH